MLSTAGSALTRHPLGGLHVFSHVRVGIRNLCNVEESKDYGHSWA